MAHPALIEPWSRNTEDVGMIVISSSDDGGKGLASLNEAVKQCMQQIHEADRMVHKKWEEALRY